MEQNPLLRCRQRIDVFNLLCASGSRNHPVKLRLADRSQWEVRRRVAALAGATMRDQPAQARDEALRQGLDRRAVVNRRAVGPAQLQPPVANACVHVDQVPALVVQPLRRPAALPRKPERRWLRNAVIKLAEIIEADLRLARPKPVRAAHISQDAVSNPAMRNRTQLLLHRLERLAGIPRPTNIQT